MKQIYNILLISAMSLLLFACQGDEEALRKNVGYLRVALEQSKEVNTKAYNAKQMHVTIKDAQGAVVEETDDHTTWADKLFALAPGEYTIEARSNAYDNNSGEDRAYYVGTNVVPVVKGETVQAKVVCSLANVKVTVAFEPEFLRKLGSGTISVQVKSATAAVTPVDFTPDSPEKVVYFPLSDLTVAYTVTSATGTENKGEKSIADVSAKDHYILNFKSQPTGSGNITVTVDPSMQQYTYDFVVDPNPKDYAALSASAWSRMAYLTASEITLADANYEALKFQYRQKGTETWTDAATAVSTTDLSHVIATATPKGLTQNTAYEYQLMNGTFEVTKGEFTTETEVALPNAGFDEWWRQDPSNNRSPWYAIASGEATSFDTQSKPMLFSFWDSGNGGTALLLGKNPTAPEETEVHTAGTKAAKLASQFVGFGSLGKFAAGNLYTGHFCSANMSTYQARINFGQPFASRPTQLKGWFKYTRGATIDYPTGDGEYKTFLTNEGGDLCSVYIALVDNEGFEYDGRKFAYEVNGDLSGDDPASFKYKSAIDFSENNKAVIAYGSLTSAEEKGTGEWQEFTIDLKYRDLTRTPKYIIIVASASKYGDYFTGSKSSVMYVDDFSLIYEGEPTMWE